MNKQPEEIFKTPNKAGRPRGSKKRAPTSKVYSQSLARAHDFIEVSTMAAHQQG